ncbi:MAG: hypothetical protein WCQ44_07180 [Opitutaceae bacterium]
MNTTCKKTMFLAIICITVFSPFALAGDLYWGTSGTWNSGTPWFSDAARTTAAAWVQGDVAHFDQAATITVPTTSITIAGIVANDNVTLTAGSAISTGSTQVSFNVASTKLLDFGTQGLITTAGTTHGIIKDGAGALAITGNGYLGGFTLNSGIVTAKSASAFGLGTLTINGGTIGATGNYAYSAFNGLNIAGDFTIGGAASGSATTATFAFAAATPVSLGSAPRTITMGGTGMVTFFGNMSGDAGAGLTLSSTITSGTVLSPFRLMGDNSGYKGITTINSYSMLKLGSENALGTIDAGTVVNSGGTLDINGVIYSAAEPVTLHGGSTFASIANNSTNEATFNGPVTLLNYAYVNGAAGKLNLTNAIAGTGRLFLAGVQGGSVSGAISVSGGLCVTNGIWTISGANTYSDSTKINTGKTLILGASGTIPDGSPLALSGTLKTGATVGFSENIGTLVVTDNATIALASGVHTLAFANSAAAVWTAGKTITITGWTGSILQSGTSGKIMVGTDANGLTPSQLAQVNFSGFGNGAVLLSNGELVPSTLAGINDIDMSSIALSVLNDGNLSISGLQQTMRVNVYNTNGMLVASKMIDSTNTNILLIQKGMYLVTIGTKTFKIVR